MNEFNEESRKWEDGGEPIPTPPVRETVEKPTLWEAIGFYFRSEDGVVLIGESEYNTERILTMGELDALYAALSDFYKKRAAKLQALPDDTVTAICLEMVIERPADHIFCLTCNGSGTINHRQDESHIPRSNECTRCDGKGHHHKSRGPQCPRCKGDGNEPESDPPYDCELCKGRGDLEIWTGEERDTTGGV